MNNSLASYTTSRDNNFNLIRFFAASLVLYSHSYVLAPGSVGGEPLVAAINMTGGRIAVDIFFITSGFLITNSYLSRNDFFAFVWARVLRIYPALIVAVLFCIAVGAWFTSLSLTDYFSHPKTHKYFLKNITLFFGIQHMLPGVFSDLPYKGFINGSLWTLPYEVKMYAILAFILFFVSRLSQLLRFISIKNTLLLIAIASVCLHLGSRFYQVLPLHFTRLFSMFFIGAAFFIWKEKICLSSKWFFVGTVLLLLCSINKNIFYLCYCLVLPFIVFYLAYVPAGVIRKFNKGGDYSYGIYIYAFPVQQSLASLVPNISVSLMVVMAFLISLLLSALSWHLIEKNALRLKEKHILLSGFVEDFVVIRRFARKR